MQHYINPLTQCQFPIGEGNMFWRYLLYFTLVFTNTLQAVVCVDTALGLLGINSIQDLLLDADGLPRSIYLGQPGLIRFVEKHSPSGNLIRIFNEVKKDLDPRTFDSLGWRYYPGRLGELKKTRAMLSDGMDRYESEKGLALFAREWVEQIQGKTEAEISDEEINIRVTYRRAVGALDEDDFKKLKWDDVFNGHFNPGRFYSLEKLKRGIERLEKIRKRILNEDGKTIRPEFLDMEGYARYAERYHNSDMDRAFFSIYNALGPSIMELAGWHHFHGTSSHYRNFIKFFRKKVVRKGLFFRRKDLSKLAGVNGQRRVAKKFFGGDINSTYFFVSVLRKKLLEGHGFSFYDLGWRLR